jgi:hypothetical protein
VWALFALIACPGFATAQPSTCICAGNGRELQVYVLSWPDRATMESSWRAFLADQEWIDIKKRAAAEHGELVNEANGQPLVRLSFSPACNKKSG